MAANAPKAPKAAPNPPPPPRNQRLSMVIVGGVLFLLGGWLLLSRLAQVPFLRELMRSFSWPLACITVPGIAACAIIILDRKRLAPLAIVGSMAIMTGMIFQHQHNVAHFESWAYLWPLVLPTAFGMGIFGQGLALNSADLRQSGLRVAMTGLGCFVLMWIAYNVLLNLGNLNVGDLVLWVCPAGLLLLGLMFVFRRPSPPKTP